MQRARHHRNPSADSRIAAEAAAACSAVVLAGAVAVVALAVAADSAAWLVVAGPIPVVALLVVVRFLDSSHPPSADFPSLSCDMFARYARAIPA